MEFMAKRWCFGTTRSPTVFQGVSRHVSRPKCSVSKLQDVPISLMKHGKKKRRYRRQRHWLPPPGWPPGAGGGPPRDRRSAWHQAASLEPASRLLYLVSKVDFQWIHSYFTLDKNPRACSGFQDLNFIFAIGFEHQEGDSDLHWSLLARYSVSYGFTVDWQPRW